MSFPASFGPDLMSRLERVAVSAARDVLTARRILPVEGPYGAGFTTLETSHDDIRHHDNANAAITVVSRAVAVPLIFRRFELSRRQVAAYSDQGQPLDLSAVKNAATTVAMREECLLYLGDPAVGLDGLMSASGRQHLDTGNWDDVEQVLKDVLSAVTLLDEQGFRGPYALVLEPRLFNGLFRRYPDGSDLLQIEHLKTLCTAGIFKTSIQGAVLFTPEAGTLFIGEDLHIDFTLTDPARYTLAVRESLVLKIDEPGAICTLAPEGSGIRSEQAPGGTAGRQGEYRGTNQQVPVKGAKAPDDER